MTPAICVEFPLGDMEPGDAMDWRNALGARIGALLEARKLGTWDGGSIGSGTVEIFFDVVDTAKATNLVREALKSEILGADARIFGM